MRVRAAVVPTSPTAEMWGTWRGRTRAITPRKAVHFCHRPTPRRRRLREDPATLEDLSQKYGISRERVRQIEVRAFEKLQLQMQRTLAEKRSHTLAA